MVTTPSIAPYRRVDDGSTVSAPEPLRYVVRANDGALITSGRVWGNAMIGGNETRAEIDASALDPSVPRTLVPAMPLSRPADGRRRLFVVLLDCGDWRISRHLIERGELPTIARLQANGRSAVLWSQPAYTAEALDSIVFPSKALRLSVPATFHKMGDELAGLASVGTNPWAAIDQFLPERPNFFSTLGAGELSAVNLLFTLGGQASGGPRNGAITGPHGQHSTRPLGVIERHLTAEEQARHPRVATDHHLGPIAAEFDLLDDEAERGAVGVVIMRIEALDLITHRSFVELTDPTLSDSELTIHAAYRYIDERLGGLAARLDGDDVFVVMSDHGIATGLKHDPRAMWIVNGPGITAGVIDGAPSLRGVPAALADLAGVKTDWPESGLTP